MVLSRYRNETYQLWYGWCNERYARIDTPLATHAIVVAVTSLVFAADSPSA